MLAPQAIVLRNDVRQAVAVADLVPGDVVMLGAGDRVPADMRLLRALIDEAALTVESVAAVGEGRTVSDNVRKVFAWTLPTNGGESIAVVTAMLAGFALPMTATYGSTWLPP